MKYWQDFLDSLSTKGGNILMMFFCVIGLMWFVHHLLSDHVTEPSIVSAAHDMMIGFGAALLAVLSGSSSRQQMADRVDTLAPSKKTEVTMANAAGTVNATSESK